MNLPVDAPVLHAVRAAVPLTAADAVTWFVPGTPPGGQVIGYVLSARAATWIRVRPDGTVETAHATHDALDEAYEMLLFDGVRELRWLRDRDGRGPAIALGENAAALPVGKKATAEPPPRRGDSHTRLLAGTPGQHEMAGWMVLRSGRYATAHLPYTFTDGDLAAIEFAEYYIEDEHGNLDVVDVRVIGLLTTTRQAMRIVTTSTPTGSERTVR